MNTIPNVDCALYTIQYIIRDVLDYAIYYTFKKDRPP